MKFSSVELQNAFEKAKPVLESIVKTKNIVSEEIKLLETFLQSQSITDFFSIQITNPYYPINLTLGLNDELVSNEERLIWDAEKKRIIYQHNQYKSESVEDGTVLFDSETKKNLLCKPLIETSFDIRKKVYEKYLSVFLLEITAKYELVALKDNEDCPF